MTPAPFSLNTHRQFPRTVVVGVIGEVDMTTAPALHAALLDALNSCTPAFLDVDLSACTFLDAAGLGVLVRVHATALASGCQMWARYPQRLVRLVLEVTNLLDVLIAPDAAVAARTIRDRRHTITIPARAAKVPAMLATS
jgi:anti-sigma B factor antagonist